MTSPVSLSRYLERVPRASVDRLSGEVLEVTGLVVEVGGLQAGVGDSLEVVTASGRSVQLEIVGFRSGRLIATPLGELTGVGIGARAYRIDNAMQVPVCEAFLGRVVDAFGRPLDGITAPESSEHVPVRAAPPDPFQRLAIDRALGTGIRAVDGFLTLGRGQRIGVFAGAGVGKSTLLGMICRSSQADANVIGLIGERGREVNDFVRSALGPEGLARSIVVAATSDQPPLIRARGAETATAYAEFLRDKGMNVLLVMDSVTRYAMALRETALATGEPPATKGYPPSVFAALPRLLERPGTTCHRGVITAVYSVLVEGDDLSDPIADAARSILDGHIVLSRDLAEKGHYPAIDVLRSASRLATTVASEDHLAAAAVLRGALATYRDSQDLIQIGAYVSGSDSRVDMAREMVPELEKLLVQRVDDPTPIEQTLARMRVLAARVAQAAR
jgi:FliI/YscN family ATPase